MSGKPAGGVQQLSAQQTNSAQQLTTHCLPLHQQSSPLDGIGFASSIDLTCWQSRQTWCLRQKFEQIQQVLPSGSKEGSVLDEEEGSVLHAHMAWAYTSWAHQSYQPAAHVVMDMPEAAGSTQSPQNGSSSRQGQTDMQHPLSLRCAAHMLGCARAYNYIKEWLVSEVAAVSSRCMPVISLAWPLAEHEGQATTTRHAQGRQQAPHLNPACHANAGVLSFSHVHENAGAQDTSRSSLLAAKQALASAKGE